MTTPEQLNKRGDKLFNQALDVLSTHGQTVWLAGIYGRMQSRMTDEDLAAMERDLTRMAAKKCYKQESDIA